MKLLLSAGNFPSGHEFLSFYTSEIKKKFPDWEVRTTGYVDPNFNLELSWSLNSISSPVFGSQNKDQIIFDLFSFSPDLILNWGNELITKWTKKNNWNMWSCGGFEVLRCLNKKQLPFMLKYIPTSIQYTWSEIGKMQPISFWPHLLNLESSIFSFPIFHKKMIQEEKGYFFLDQKMKEKIQYWPMAEEKIFLSNGLTSDLYCAFQNQFPKIFLFPNSKDPDIVCNAFLLEQFNLGRQWKGEEEIKFSLLPKIDYKKLNLSIDGNNILDYLQEKYSLKMPLHHL